MSIQLRKSEETKEGGRREGRREEREQDGNSRVGEERRDVRKDV